MTDVQGAALMEAVPRRLDSAVEVDELRKEFRRRDGKRRRGERRVRVALDSVSFTMETGETVAILGQNGSGKSTLVRLLSTLLLPDGGSARIHGHDVIAAYDGHGAIAAARLHRPDLILLDIGMPDVNGYDVARRIREEPTPAGAPRQA